MEDMTIEQQIFYFKEGVQGDVENERGIAIKIIDKLQADNNRLRKALDIAKTHLEYQYPLRAIEVIDKALQQGEK